tara:strand:+ start:4386 stop:4562 length:177 start_codon:yes stop_codon:yes gene_type:complete
MKKESHIDLRNPKNFYNPSTSYNKIEQCKIYDKDGNLVKIISAQEIIDQNWKKMKLNP